MSELEDPKPESEEPKKVTNNDLRNSQFGGGFINADTVNAQRIGGDILNFFFGQQTTTPVGNPARPKNERLLLAAVKEEVTARLRQSLHNAVLINVGKESQPQQVKRPWDNDIKIGLKFAEPLPDNTTILQVFDSEGIAGKLLILGAPGAGKTTTQLELAQELIKRAEEQPDYSMPVLLNLSSWKDDRQSITDWLVAELKSKYGVSTKLGQEWVNNQQLLPLLDGLDELEPQRQEICVQAINSFLTSETRPSYLVVCSRSEEYSNYASQLQLNGAIYLQHLSTNQICDYLTSISYLELWTTISSDLDLLELVKIPLLLSITVLASQEISVKQWQQLTSTAERLQYLLDTYVVIMLEREIKNNTYARNKLPNKEQTQIWLIWLAQQLQKEFKTEILIEKLQPSGGIFDFSEYILLYRLTSGIISGIICGIISGIISEPLVLFFEGKDVGLSFVISIGLYYFFIVSFSKDDIKIAEKLNFSLKNFSLRMTLRMTLQSYTEFLRGNNNNYLIYVLLFIFTLPILFIIESFKKLEVEIKTIPNQGIWNSLNNAIIMGLIIGLLGYLSGSLVGWWVLGKNSILFLGLFFSLFFGLSGALNFGGQACIQHFTLRIILYRDGCIPWNYARFLDYCTERMLLQRVGGRYRFIHKLLQDHFAQMGFEIKHPK